MAFAQLHYVSVLHDDSALAPLHTLSHPCCRQFTDAALGLSLTVLNSLIDLVSFSGILYSIYPPLFGALLAYAIGGTLGSIALGKVRLWGPHRPLTVHYAAWAGCVGHHCSLQGNKCASCCMVHGMFSNGMCLYMFLVCVQLTHAHTAHAHVD